LNVNVSNDYIVYDFIRVGAGTIIKSDEYSSENQFLFNLVEALDPVCRRYMGATKREAIASDL